MRPLCQRLQRRGFNGDGRTTVRPYTGLHVTCVRCIKGYSVRALTRTDARAVRPYTGLHVTCVRCVIGYNVVVLTGTDAQTECPYRSGLQRLMSEIVVLT